MGKEWFVKALTVTWARYGKAIEPEQAKAMYQVLKDVSEEEVAVALEAHTRNPEHGRWPPVIADIAREIYGARARLAYESYGTRSLDADPIAYRIEANFGAAPPSLQDYVKAYRLEAHLTRHIGARPLIEGIGTHAKLERK